MTADISLSSRSFGLGGEEHGTTFFISFLFMIHLLQNVTQVLISYSYIVFPRFHVFTNICKNILSYLQTSYLIRLKFRRINNSRFLKHSIDGSIATPWRLNEMVNEIGDKIEEKK
jgi:hypothetical protein